MAEPQTTPTSDTQSVFDHAQRMSSPMEAPDSWRGAPVVLVPKGWTPVAVPGWEPTTPPDHVSATVIMEDGESFARYVCDYKSPNSQVFGSREGLNNLVVVAVLDYHGAATSDVQFCKHRVEFTPKLAVPWLRWTQVDRKPFGQAEFAQFLEENIADIQNPSGGDLLKIINALEIDGALVFQKAIRLQDGTVKFSFQNEQKAKSGDIEVPSEFQLALQVFEGEPHLRVQARLRYRLSSTGELKVWFEMVNAHKAVEVATLLVLERIQKGCGIRPFLGRPPK